MLGGTVQTPIRLKGFSLFSRVLSAVIKALHSAHNLFSFNPQQTERPRTGGQQRFLTLNNCASYCYSNGSSVSTQLLKEISLTMTVTHNHTLTYAWPSTRVTMDTNSRVIKRPETWSDKWASQAATCSRELWTFSILSIRKVPDFSSWSMVFAFKVL